MAASASSSNSRTGKEELGGERKPHVLAVDDSVVDRKIIENLLTNSACKVTTAENGKKALEFLGLADGKHSNSTDLKVNLVITDYSMPGMTGYELLKKIKESPTMKEIPVVIVSSEKNPRRMEQCLEEGANGFFIKPLRKSDVKKLRCYMKDFNYPSTEMLCMGR